MTQIYNFKMSIDHFFGPRKSVLSVSSVVRFGAFGPLNHLHIGILRFALRGC